MSNWNEQVGTSCSGECIKCTERQRIYCAAQIGYTSVLLLNRFNERLAAIDERLKAMSEKDNDENGLLNPMGAQGVLRE